jgi:hypothetical protein
MSNNDLTQFVYRVQLVIKDARQRVEKHGLSSQEAEQVSF